VVLNYIWIGFFLIALVVAIIKTFNGNLEVFSNIVNSTFNMAETSFEISIGLTGVLCLWLGIMNIGEKGGTIQILSKLVGPFFSKLFPDVPEDHPARGSMLMNFSANMLGLDNAATPMGLKAMTELQELNPEKDTASNAQIMFLVLNTSGLTLIPITVMNYRNMYGAVNPSDVFIPILICTFFASLVGLIVVSIYQKINLFDKVILAYLGGLTSIVVGMLLYFRSLSAEDLQMQSQLVSNIILYGIICTFIIMALIKKVNVYNAFIEGAKGGFEIAIKIIPFLVAILVSIGVFRASGALDYLEDGMHWFFGLFLDTTEFVEALPTAFMKPLSGTGARGMMLDAFEAHGVDSFIGRLSATFQGATDTTFYIIAVYFGSVGIKKTRYAIKAGLLADLAGIVAAVIIATMFFGGDKTTHFSNTEIVNQFVNEWNVNQQSKYLDDEFTYFDQTFDDHTLKEMTTEYPKFNEVYISEKEIGDKTVIFYKSSINSQTSAFKFNVEKQKIKSIQLMSNFEN
jgi:spore maturation protein SpmA